MIFFKNLKKNYYILSIIIFTLIPLGYLPQLFDGVLIDYALETGNIDAIEFWYKDAIRYFHFYLIYLVNILSKFTLIPHEFFLDLFSVLFLILYCLETKKIAKSIFNLNEKFCNLAAFFTSIFPVWHTLVAFNISQYLFSFYCVLFGYRNFISNNPTKVFVGFVFIILSFEVESSLSFIIGLSFVHFLLNRKNKINNLLLSKVIFIFFLCFVYFIFKANLFPPTGYWTNYNNINFDLLSNLSVYKVITNIFNYSTYLLVFIWIPFFYYFKIIFKKIIKIEKIKKFNLFYNEYFLLIFLSVFAIFPYLLLDKSSSIFYLGDYYQRHAFLLAPIFGIFFATLFRDMQKVNLDKKTIILNFYLFCFIFINLTLLSYGNIRKIEAFHFKNNLIAEFKNYDVIPKGDVQILSKSYPADLRSFEISHILYKAYNKTAWWGFMASKREERKPMKRQGVSIFDNKEYSALNIISDYFYECKSYIYLKNDLNKLNRFRKFYVINYKNYFVFDKIISECE
jgi:hypothetical protein